MRISGLDFIWIRLFHEATAFISYISNNSNHCGAESIGDLYIKASIILHSYVVQYLQTVSAAFLRVKLTVFGIGWYGIFTADKYKAVLLRSFYFYMTVRYIIKLDRFFYGIVKQIGKYTAQMIFCNSVGIIKTYISVQTYIGSAINAVNSSNMRALEACTKMFRQWEEHRWQELYLLYTFEPAEGKIGEIYKGNQDKDGFVGHCFEKNGDYFEGFFANNGTRLGIFVFANGDRVFGSMYNGIKYDYCYCLGADGSRIAGEFENNQLTDGVIMTDSCAFLGDWQNGQLHGVGYARYADNSCFAGEWSHGRPVE